METKVVQAVKPNEIAKERAPAAGAPETPPKAPPRFTREGGSKTIPLEWPLEFDGVEYAELTVSRLRGKSFKRMRDLQGRYDDDDIVLHCVTGAPIEVILALDADDYTAVQEASYDFLPKGLMAKAAEAMASEEEQSKSSNTPNSSDGGGSSSSNSPSTPPSSPPNSDTPTKR